MSAADAAALRALLSAAADDIERGYCLTDRDAMVVRLRQAAEDLLAPEVRARREAMRARLAEVAR